jgi:glyoxylate carboligase
VPQRTRTTRMAAVKVLESDGVDTIFAIPGGAIRRRTSGRRGGRERVPAAPPARGGGRPDVADGATA